MMSDQLIFDLNAPPNYHDDNYFVSDANQTAYKWITDWPHWNSYGHILVGPEFSGKSHLSSIWFRKANACQITFAPNCLDEARTYLNQKHNLVIEDIDETIDEQSLFHILNMVKENQQYILLTSKSPVASLNLTLKDLNSRLKSLSASHIESPDDMLLKAIYMKRFSDLQIKVDHRIIDYILLHTERSYHAIDKVCNNLNNSSLSAKHKLTLPLVKQSLNL